MKLALGLIASVVAVAPSAQQQRAPNISSVEVETTSWGRLVARWKIDDTGDLRYTSPEPDVFNAQRIVTRRYKVGREGYDRIRKMLGSAERSATHPFKCTQAMTDAVYGNVTWHLPPGRVRKLDFYTACSERTARLIVGQIGTADALAKSWAMQGQIIETKPVERPR